MVQPPACGGDALSDGGQVIVRCRGNEQVNSDSSIHKLFTQFGVEAGLGTQQGLDTQHKCTVHNCYTLGHIP